MLPVTHVAVNLSALRHNVAQVRQHLHPQSSLLAVVKANGYGHGAALAAQAFVAAGAQWLGTGTVAEGIELRQAGIAVPILVFLPTSSAEECAALVEHHLTGTIVAISQLHDLAEAAKAQGRACECHIYVDSGLGRLGSNDSLPDILEALSAYPMVTPMGIYTHFGPPGSGMMLQELETLRPGGAVKGFVGLAREAAAHFTGQQLTMHLASSRLFLQSRDAHQDMVRLGTLLYGQYPDDARERPLTLREDTFALCTRVIALQRLPKGSRIGYGGEFVTARETLVGTVPVGTAQGLGMAPSSAAGRGRALVRAALTRWEARRGGTLHAPLATVCASTAPIIGRISMDQCCLDVTDIPEVAVGSPVSLPTRRLTVDGLIPRLAIEDPPA